MAVDVAGLIMQIGKTGDGFPVVVRWGTVMTPDMFIVLLPWLEVIPAAKAVLVRHYIIVLIGSVVNIGVRGALADTSHF